MGDQKGDAGLSISDFLTISRDGWTYILLSNAVCLVIAAVILAQNVSKYEVVGWIISDTGSTQTDENLIAVINTSRFVHETDYLFEVQDWTTDDATEVQVMRRGKIVSTAPSAERAIEVFEEASDKLASFAVSQLRNNLTLEVKQLQKYGRLGTHSSEAHFKTLLNARIGLEVLATNSEAFRKVRREPKLQHNRTVALLLSSLLIGTGGGFLLALLRRGKYSPESAQMQ